jgi:hypothetical protein
MVSRVDNDNIIIIIIIYKLISNYITIIIIIIINIYRRSVLWKLCAILWYVLRTLLKML